MSSPFPTFQTSRIHLMQIRSEDQALIFKGLSHPEVIPYYGVQFESFEATQTQMEWYRALEASDEGIWWAIWSHDQSQFMGAAGLNNVQKSHQKAEIGAWLLPEFWGKGYILEALDLVCVYGFRTLGLHRIEGWVESENQACKRAISKLGFSHEGTLRECEWKNGQWIHLDIYAKLNHEHVAGSIGMR
jgi:ribosomal-protein-alanine N-acetyltransferase